MWERFLKDKGKPFINSQRLSLCRGSRNGDSLCWETWACSGREGSLFPSILLQFLQFKGMLHEGQGGSTPRAAHEERDALSTFHPQGMLSDPNAGSRRPVPCSLTLEPSVGLRDPHRGLEHEHPP